MPNQRISSAGAAQDRLTAGAMPDRASTAGRNLLFLREEELRLAQDLLQSFQQPISFKV